MAAEPLVRDRTLVVRDVVFYAALLAIIRWRVDPSLLYHGHGIVLTPLFSTDRLFVADRLWLPGGPGCLVDAWVAQWSGRPWLGALLLTAMAGVLGVLADRLARALAGGRVAGVRFGPPLLCLVIYLSAHTLGIVLLGIALGISAALVYLRLERTPWRLVWLLVAAPLIYWATGAGYLLLLLLAAGREWRERPRRVWGLVLLAVGEAVPWAWCRWVNDGPVTQAYQWLLPANVVGQLGTQVAVGLWCYYLLLAALAGRWRRLTESVGAGRPGAREGLAWVLLLGSTAGASHLGYDPRVHQSLRLATLSQERQWPAVIALVRAMPSSDQGLYCGYAYLRALQETGRVLDEMFTCAMSRYALMLEPLGPANARAKADYRILSFPLLDDLLLEMGHVNNAEREASEAREALGPSPACVSRLALIATVKRHPEAARTLLRTLLGVPGATDHARRELAKLAADPSGDSDPHVRALRAVAATVDPPELLFDFEARTRDLLVTNPANRKAFDYLMIYELLNDRPAAVVEALRHLRAAGYQRLPRHLAEAVLVAEDDARHPVALPGLTVDDAVRQRFRRFQRTLGCDSGDLSRLRSRLPDGVGDKLRAEFGDSFFFYHTFGRSGGRP